MDVGQTPPDAGAPGPAPAAPPAGPSQEDRTLAMLAHLLGIVSGFLGALIIWLVKKDQSAFVNDQGKEALNFQITVLVAWIALFVITTVLGAITFGIGGIMLMPLMLILWVVNIIFCIMGGVAANNGQHYRYPVNWRLIK